MKTFEMTNEHLTLLSSMYVDWQHCEAVAPCINPKRPYGNTDFVKDIAEILGWELFEDAHSEKHLSRQQYDFAIKLHKEMKDALQIVLLTQRFQTGTYIKKSEYDDRSWELEQI